MQIRKQKNAKVGLLVHRYPRFSPFAKADDGRFSPPNNLN